MDFSKVWIGEISSSERLVGFGKFLNPEMGLDHYKWQCQSFNLLRLQFSFICMSVSVYHMCALGPAWQEMDLILDKANV